MGALKMLLHLAPSPQAYRPGMTRALLEEQRAPGDAGSRAGDAGRRGPWRERNDGRGQGAAAALRVALCWFVHEEWLVHATSAYLY